MSIKNNDFNKTRYEYLKGHTFKTEQGVEGFIERLNDEGLMCYVPFGDIDINRKGVLEFNTKTHIITLKYKKTKGVIESTDDPVIRDRRSQLRVTVSDTIKAKNYRDEDVLSELKLINISTVGLLCKKPKVRLNLGECINCLGAYYKIVRITNDSIGMEFKHTFNEQEHKMMLSDVMWGGEIDIEG